MSDIGGSSGGQHYVIAITQIESAIGSSNESSTVEILLDDRLQDGITDVMYDQTCIQHFKKVDVAKMMASDINASRFLRILAATRDRGWTCLSSNSRNVVGKNTYNEEDNAIRNTTSQTS